MNKLLTELRRRSIFRVAGVYAVVGWLLAQAAGVLENSIGLPSWFDGFVVATLLIGFPIAMLLAWAFETTPEGVKRSEAVADADSTIAKPARALDYVIIAGLVLVGVLIIADRMVPKKAESITVTGAPANEVPSTSEAKIAAASIAVLPFTDLSPNKDQEYFSDGIAEEILNVLVRVEALSVASRTSSFQFKGRDIGIPEIAQALKVRHVLEGSVRKAGDTLRITAQLIDTSNDRHLWSQTYDRPLTAENIFVIQDEIATAIVKALSDTLGMTGAVDIEVAAPTENLTAYDLYLKARPLFQARTDLDKADALLIRALEQDPKFAKAWEMRAAVQSLMNEYGYADTTDEEADRRSITFADRAIALVPMSATAIAVKAKIRMDANQTFRGTYDYEDIITDFKKALEIEPRNASALTWLGMTYINIGADGLASQTFEKCIKYEPFYVPCAINNYIFWSARGGDKRVLDAFRDRLGKGGSDVEDAPYGALSRLDEELAFMMAMNGSNLFGGWRRSGELYQAYKNLDGDHQDLIRAALVFASRNPDRDQVTIASILTPIGYFENEDLIYDIWDPVYKNYRQSPQFKIRIKKSAVYDYWRKNGFPPQCKPLGEDDFVCD
jgi:TolB-like protein/tetratricopeptide (TPR) repeat protein